MFYMLAILFSDVEARKYLKRRYINVMNFFYELFLGKTLVRQFQTNENVVPERRDVFIFSVTE